MRRWILGTAALWAGLSGASAQPAADPAALTALRQTYQTLLTEAEAPARARWLAALEAQERRRVAEGDFEGAAQIRERRLGLVPGKAGTGLGRGPVVLAAATARTTTAVDFADGKKEVARFRRTGAMMEWELPGQAPGTYQVKLTFGVIGEGDQNDAPDSYKDPAVPLPVRESLPAGAVVQSGPVVGGGVVEFRKLTNLKEGGALLRCSVRSTGGWATERTLTLGQVDLDGKSVKFSLRAVDGLPAGVMDFRRLELVPVAAAPAVADAAALKEFARLQEVYQKQFTELTRGPTAKYAKALGELEVIAVRNRDTEALALVRQEKQRLSQPDGRSPGVTAAVPGNQAVRVLPVTEKLYMLMGGEARLTTQGDFLTKLRPANGCEISWKLAGLGVPSGTYAVEVECRLTPEHGGTANLLATTPGGNSGPAMPLTVEPPAFDPASIITKRRPDGTPGTSALRTFSAGQVTIPKGSEYLKLQVISLTVPDGALCDLKALRLTPVPAASP